MTAPTTTGTLVSVYQKSAGTWHAGIYGARGGTVDLGDFDSPIEAQAAAEQWIRDHAVTRPDSAWRVAQLDKWVDQREVG